MSRVGTGTPRNILVIQTAFIGDVVLVEPLLAQAKASFPDAAIDVLVIPAAALLLQGNPNLRQVIVFAKRGRDAGLGGLLKLAARFRAAQYDLALVPHRSLRSALLAFLARIPVRIGFANSAGRWLFTHRLPYPQTHEVLRNLALLQPLGIEADYRDPVIYPTEAEHRKVVQELARCGELKIALAPGSVWATKRWPQERFVELGRRLVQELRASVLVIGGADDAELAAAVCEGIGAGCCNLAGKLSLRESVAALVQCRVLVSNDSAPTHLGVAAGCRVVTLFGSTVPRFGFYPFGEQHRVVEIDRALSCRPCGIHGKKRCPTGTFECMRVISIEQVFEVVRERVEDAAVE